MDLVEGRMLLPTPGSAHQILSPTPTQPWERPKGGPGLLRSLLASRTGDLHSSMGP